MIDEETPVSFRMLVVDDNTAMRQLLASAFSERDFDVVEAESGEEAIALLATETIHIVITDYAMPGKDGLEVLRAAKSVNTDIEVIIITGYGTIESAVEAMRLGAYDYITKPIKLNEIENKVDKIVRKLRTRSPRHAHTWIHPSVRHFVGASAQTRQLLKMITRVAPSHSSVLITGPSGVGKELVARAIHEASPRREKPFVPVNCAALAPSVLESELFGHERGAFTGATERRVGRFERAHTGTIFLDEVGEISPGIQTKLLRVLQEGELERVGGNEPIKVDVRVVAATNRDLYDAMQHGEFREDFYYRLNVISLRVPALAERKDDIPALVDHFLRKYSLELHKEVFDVADDVIGIFMTYPWPGNVRELENVIERAIVLAEGDLITREELPGELLMRREPPPGAQAPAPPPLDTLTERTDRLESELIKRALEKFRWNKTKAAEHLGLKRTTLQYKIKKYELE